MQRKTKGSVMKTTKVGIRRSPAATKAARAKSSGVIDLVPALIKVKTILVPIDFSETANKALVYAIRMADQFGSKIVLLNVVEPVATPDFAYHPLMLETDKAKKLAKGKLEELSRRARIPSRMLDRVLVRYGSPFAEITSAARTLKVDLIILTTHGYTGLKHVFMGSTAERVVRHAPCPVLTVREKEHEFV